MQELKLITQPDFSLLNEYNKFELVAEKDYIMVDWNMGNTCNYSCTYCDEHIHNGTFPWVEEDVAFDFVKRCTDHYKSMGKELLWNLLGGEPTVWSKFTSFFKRVKEYDPDCRIRVLTNGSRTINWWDKTSKVLDDIIISYHPESADINHINEVTKTLRKNGVFHTIQVCLYPPYLDKCYEAAEYFHNNSQCNAIIVKSLKITLGSPETFVYDKEYLDRVMVFDGEPKWTMKNLSDEERRNIYAKRMFFRAGKKKLEILGGGNELMRNGQNTWKGWDCYIGIETLVVEMDGKVTAGSSCNHDCNLGNIKEPSSIKFPTTPVRCQWKWCSCIADIEVTKEKP
jgi:MoaA/NifB/PqqE/SkfB family radical SAM enzyme